MMKFKVGDKVLNNFPLTGDSSEACYAATHGEIGKIIEVNHMFYLVKFNNFNRPLHFMERELVLVPQVKDTIPACDLEIGQIGRIVSNHIYDGVVILRFYDGLVSLNNPEDTWHLEDATFHVEKYNNGEKFTIIAK